VSVFTLQEQPPFYQSFTFPGPPGPDVIPPVVTTTMPGPSDGEYDAEMQRKRWLAWMEQRRARKQQQALTPVATPQKLDAKGKPVDFGIAPRRINWEPPESKPTVAVPGADGLDIKAAILRELERMTQEAQARQAAEEAERVARKKRDDDDDDDAAILFLGDL